MSKAKDLLVLAKDALAAAGEPHAEIYVVARHRGCARFSVNELSQHMALESVEARVRVALGTRVAETSTNDLDRAALVASIARTKELAQRAPETPGWPGFADAGAPTPDVPRFEARTANLDDGERAEIAAKAIDRIRDTGLVAAGIVETIVHHSAVATTSGCARSHDGTSAEMRVWALEDAAGRGASGHAGRLVRNVDDLDAGALVEEAVRIAKLAKDPGTVDAGTWDVVMEPPAVAELLEWLGMIAFGAPEIEHGKSPLTDRFGERVSGAAITIVEDPLDATASGFAIPFDREGSLRSKVSLIERGIAKGMLYDRLHAARAKTTSTGSAFVADFGSADGVGSTALHIDGGSAASSEELINGMERGLWVRRLHYVNGFVDTRRSVMTGLTRDGCFLVEHGKVVRAVGNVRFTDSFLDMLARADAMTMAREACACSWTENGTLVVPAIRFRGVRFTSGSKKV